MRYNVSNYKFSTWYRQDGRNVLLTCINPVKDTNNLVRVTLTTNNHGKNVKHEVFLLHFINLLKELKLDNVKITNQEYLQLLN